ncbi:MAG TPA: apolipoprotein N-acyltransferase, partial [Paracoccaceae bacterium]|nr:apolipoprotein N-acyltransferase [Paracoccaceae bacterium]
MLARPMAALAGLNGWRKMIATFLAGVAMGFTQAPWSLWPLFFVSLPIFFGLLGSSESKRSRFGVGWAFGLGYFCLALSWIVEPFMIDAARYGWMAPFALVGLAGGLALIWGVASTPRGGALQVVA